MLGHALGQAHKFGYAQLFGPLVEYGVGGGLGGHSEGLQGISQRLAARLECLLHDPKKQLLVATKPLGSVTGESHHGRLHLGRRHEYVRRHREQVLNGIVCLQQYAQDAVGFGAGRLSQALGHFLLNHAHHLAHLLPVIEHGKKNLAADVVGKVADDGQRLVREHCSQALLQKIGGVDAVGQRRVVHFQVSHRLGINLDHAGLVSGIFEQILREHTHAGANFQHLAYAVGQLQGPHDVAGNIGVGQKMLTEVFFGANGIHGWAGEVVK